MPTATPISNRCGGSKLPDDSLRLELPVLAAKNAAIRPSRMSRRRAAVLIAVHLLIIGHVVHWLVTGRTVSPVEPSEAMYTLDNGYVNAGFIFFGVSIVATLIFGRFFCGWGCHLVAYQDLCGWLLKKVGIRPRPFRSRILVFAPLALALYMFVWPTVYRMAAGHNAPRLTNHLVTSEFWKTFPGPGVALLTFAVCGFIIVYFLGNKGFCTYACPYGGFFGLADKVARGRIRVTDDCEHCGHCTAVCSSNVRVHEEVARFGMVVDPGCMKCMDCVSVCPKEALYFSLRPRSGNGAAGHAERSEASSVPDRHAESAAVGKLREASPVRSSAVAVGHAERSEPSLAQGPSRHAERSEASPVLPVSAAAEILRFAQNDAGSGAHRGSQSPNHQIAKSPNRTYDFTLIEELLMVAIGLVSVLAYRGLYNKIPLLLAMGMAAITAFLTLKLLRLLTSTNVRLQNLQLKTGGRLRASGLTFASAVALLLFFTAHSAAVQYQSWRGSSLFRSLNIDDDAWLPGDKWWQSASTENRTRANRAIAHLSRADRWGLFSTSSALLDLVWLHLAKGDTTAAEATVRRLIGLMPDDANVHRGLAGVLRKAGRMTEAEAAYRRALDLDPAFDQVRSELAGLLIQTGRPEAAIDEYRAGMKASPGNARFATEAARGLAMMGRPQDAVAELQRFVERNPASATAWSELGGLKLRLGQVDAGLSDLRRAVELNPTLIEPRYNLALALLAIAEGDSSPSQPAAVQEAIALLEGIVVDRPSFSEAHYNLAVGKFMVGRVEEALSHVREALRLAPDDAQANAFLEMLSGLQKTQP